MKKLGRLKLNELSEDVLCYREMNALRGGEPDTDGCACSCASPTYDNHDVYSGGMSAVGTKYNGGTIVCDCACQCGNLDSATNCGHASSGAAAETGH